MGMNDVMVSAGVGALDVIDRAAKAVGLPPDAAAADDEGYFTTRNIGRQRPRSRHRAQGNPFHKLPVERQRYYLIDVPHRNPPDPHK